MKRDTDDGRKMYELTEEEYKRPITKEEGKRCKHRLHQTYSRQFLFFRTHIPCSAFLHQPRPESNRQSCVRLSWQWVLLWFCHGELYYQVQQLTKK